MKRDETDLVVNAAQIRRKAQTLKPSVHYPESFSSAEIIIIVIAKGMRPAFCPLHPPCVWKRDSFDRNVAPKIACIRIVTGNSLYVFAIVTHHSTGNSLLVLSIIAPSCNTVRHKRSVMHSEYRTCNQDLIAKPLLVVCGDQTQQESRCPCYHHSSTDNIPLLTLSILWRTANGQKSIHC